MPLKHASAAFLAAIALIALPAAASGSVTNTIITSGPSGTIGTDSATFTFISPLDGGFQCRLDSDDPGSWSSCASPQSYASLADGAHIFEVRALNRPQNPDPTPSVASFYVVTEPPETTLTSGPSGTIAVDSAIFAFTSSQPGSFQCRLDSSDESAWSPCASPRFYSALADGSHSFEVRAVNEVGDVDPTPAAGSFTVDTEAPETTITAGPSGTVDVASPTFAFISSEAGSFQCRLDSVIWSPCTSPQPYSSLADGSHSFEVRAADLFGNTDQTPALAAFDIYTGPPLPVAGVSVNLELKQGNVQLQCPGEDEYSRLTSFKQVPVGCLINTRNGVVDLTASKGKAGLQNADFWGGVFIVSQEAGDNKEVGLKLAGRRMCERRGSPSGDVAASSRSGGKGRKLWGSGKGNYKTSGSYGSATVRGTTWLVVDRCDSSTLIKVEEGIVSVRDFVKDKLLSVLAGGQYVAKAAIPRLNPDKWS